MAKGYGQVLALLVAAALVLGIAVPGRTAGTFSDLEGHWARQKIEDLVAAGVISPGEKFRPREPVTRADFVKMLVLAADLPQVVSFPPTFTDVDQDDWFYNFVETAAHYGIVKGDAAGRFRPFEGLTREQMATMVMRALGDSSSAGAASLARFKDADRISSWAKEDVARAVARGVLNGTDQGFLFPSQAATRDQAAAVAWQVWKVRGQVAGAPPAGTSPQPAMPSPSPTGSSAVTVLGPTRLKVSFPRDLDPASLQAGPAGNFTLVFAGTAFSPGLVSEALLASTREVVLTVPALEVGKEYTLSARDLRDTYGQKLNPNLQSFTFTVPADNSPPLLTGVRSTGPATLELTFSDDLDPVTASRVTNYRLRESGAEPLAALVSGRTVALVFTGQLATGSTYTLELGQVADLWGNRAPATSRTFSVHSDTFPPRALGARAASSTAVEVQFNENLASLGSFTLKHDGQRINVVRAEQTGPGLVRLTAYLGEEGRYQLEVSGARDVAGNQAGAATLYFTFTGGETGGLAFPPEVEEVRTGLGLSDELVVVFSQPVASAGAEKVRNYQLTAADDLSVVVEVDEAILESDGKTVRLTLAEPLTAGLSYRYFISGVEGVNGEEMIPAAGYFVAGSGSGFVTRVVALDARRVQVTFGQDVLGQFATSNYGIMEKETGRLIPVLAVENAGEARSVVLKLGQDLSEDEDYTFSAGNTLTDSSGRLLPTFTGNFRATFTRAARLRLLEVKPIDTRSFRLTFSKPVQEVKVDLAGYVLEYEYYGAVVLVRANRSFRTGGTYRLEVWARDRDNPPQVLDWEEETLEFDEPTTGTEVEEVVAATSQRVKVRFNGPLDPETANDAENYYLRQGSTSGPVLWPVKAEYDPARFLVWLYLPTSSSLGDGRYYLTVDGVKDVQGNRLGSDESYRFYGVDTVPPVVVLPHFPNQEGQPVVLRTGGGTATLVGGPGAVEREAYVRVYVDDVLVRMTRAEEDGSFASLDLGTLSGRHTLRLVVTDVAGNTGERSQVYDL